MSRRLIDERAVRQAAKSGKSLAVSPGDIVTDAARDLARDLGVALTDKDTNPPRVVAVGSDHGGFMLKEALKPAIAELKWEINDVGCSNTDAVDYPIFAARVADLVAGRHTQFGIMIDGAGIGSAMVANKVAGVRAALCYDLTTAKNAREHNNANLLTLGGGLIGEKLAADIVRVFLTTEFAGGRHAKRVAMIDALDRES